MQPGGTKSSFGRRASVSVVCHPLKSDNSHTSLYSEVTVNEFGVIESREHFIFGTYIQIMLFLQGIYQCETKQKSVLVIKH